MKDVSVAWMWTGTEHRHPGGSACRRAPRALYSLRAAFQHNPDSSRLRAVKRFETEPRYRTCLHRPPSAHRASPISSRNSSALYRLSQRRLYVPAGDGFVPPATAGNVLSKRRSVTRLGASLFYCLHNGKLHIGTNSTHLELVSQINTLQESSGLT